MLRSWLIDLANAAIFIHLLGKLPIDMTDGVLFSRNPRCPVRAGS